MPRWLEILLTLVLFTAGMAVIGAGLRATVPMFDDWLVSNVGQAGAWALLLLFWTACGVVAWRGHRPKGDGAAGR